MLLDVGLVGCWLCLFCVRACCWLWLLYLSFAVSCWLILYLLLVFLFGACRCLWWFDDVLDCLDSVLVDGFK